MKILRLPNSYLLFQLVLPKFFKSELFTCLLKVDHVTTVMQRAYGRGRTNAFGVYIGHKICHRVPATSATLLSRPAITMSEGPKDQKSRCPASKQVISCPMAVK